MGTKYCHQGLENLQFFAFNTYFALSSQMGSTNQVQGSREPGRISPVSLFRSNTTLNEPAKKEQRSAHVYYTQGFAHTMLRQMRSE